jgi:hypothetical protein
MSNKDKKAPQAPAVETPGAETPQAQLKKAADENKSRERFCYARGLTTHNCEIGGRRYNFKVNEVFEVFDEEDMKILYSRRVKVAIRIGDDEAVRLIEEAKNPKPDTEDI